VAFSSRVGDPAHLPLVAAFEAASKGKSKVKILEVSSLSVVTLDEIGERGVELKGKNPDGSETCERLPQSSSKIKRCSRKLREVRHRVGDLGRRGLGENALTHHAVAHGGHAECGFALERLAGTWP
jgi:hypothetical protein